jgi:hypothetical protein
MDIWPYLQILAEARRNPHPPLYQAPNGQTQLPTFTFGGQNTGGRTYAPNPFMGRPQPQPQIQGMPAVESGTGAQQPLAMQQQEARSRVLINPRGFRGREM